MAGNKITVASTPQEVVKSINAIVEGTSKVANTADAEKSVAYAAKANKDNKGQIIDSTYIKSLSVSGKRITYTRGDDTTGSIDTQDEDTKYTHLPNPYALTLKGNGTEFTNGVYDGSAAKTVNITPASIGAAPETHEHSQYATVNGGSVEKANEAAKVSNSLSIQLNGGTATTFDGSTAKSINVTPSSIGALPTTGGAITGTLKLTKVTDLSGTANNSPALIVGGQDTGAHLELDSNEIQAKKNGTTVDQLYLNNDGGQVNIGSGGLSINGTITATTYMRGSTNLDNIYAPYTHSHSYAGASTSGGAATSANKVNSAITFNNGGAGAASGTTFDGSTARTISYNSVGAAAAGHTHSYAGSDAVGGVANSAKKLNNGTADLAVGSATNPVYFANGVPVACSNLGITLKTWSE